MNPDKEKALDQLSAVYMIFNNINKKKYIGGTVNIRNRWRAHKSSLRNDHHHNIELQKDWNYFGENCFDFYVLQKVKSQLVYQKESELLTKIKPEYNSQLEVRGYQNGASFSKRHKKRISDALTGRKLDSEHCKRLSKTTKDKRIGSDNANAILNEDQVKEIKGEIKKGFLYKDIAENYNVSTRTISAIANNYIWGSVEAPNIAKDSIEKTHKDRLSELYSGRNNPNYGNVHSDKTKEKIGLASKERDLSKQAREKISKKPKGERNGRAKLCENDVREIKREIVNTNISLAKLANMYKVSKSTISAIKTGRNWPHIELEEHHEPR